MLWVDERVSQVDCEASKCEWEGQVQLIQQYCKAQWRNSCRENQSRYQKEVPRHRHQHQENWYEVDGEGADV